MRRRTAFVCLLVGGGISLCLLAQGPIEPRIHPGTQPKQADPKVNLRANATLVLVPIQVNDKMNRPVGGLDPENFKVYDDQVEQKIISFSMEDDPVAIGLVYDVSGSMGGNTKMAWSMAHDTVKLANPGDEMCVVTVASQAKLVIPLTLDENQGDVDQQLFFAKGGGTTALLDGIYLALNELKKSKKQKRAMVVISDGLENNSRYSMREVLTAAEESDVLIYGITGGAHANGTATQDDKEVLHDLTAATGGRLFPAPVIGPIITDLRNHYVLGFAPTDPTRDGRFHHLVVKFAPPKGLPKTYLHWKTGYYAASN